MQRILRDVNNKDCAFAMKIMRGQARRRIFDNLSRNLGLMLAENMEYMGPIRLRDAEEAIARIVKTYIRLAENGEIEGAMLSEIKLVLDIYTTVEKYNHELEDKYKDIREIIDDIHNYYKS